MNYEIYQQSFSFDSKDISFNKAAVEVIDKLLDSTSPEPSAPIFAPAAQDSETADQIEIDPISLNVNVQDVQDESSSTSKIHHETDKTDKNAESIMQSDLEAVVVSAPESVPAPVFKPDIMLIDISGLAYAAMYTPQGNLSHQGFPTGAIHGAMSSIFSRMAHRPSAVPVVLWDSKAYWRHEMFEPYKATRGVDPEKKEIRDRLKMQIPYIQLLLLIMGIPQVICGGAEADDLAGVICRGLDASWIVELLSSDTDWWQQLDERTAWYSPVHKKGLSLKGLSSPDNGMKDGHFLSTNEYLEAKALAGDKSDEIPGILGVGLLTACKIIRQHGTSIRDFWDQVDSGKVVPKGVIMTRMAQADSRAIFERNIQLMDWRKAPPLDMQQLAITAGRPDFDQLEAEASCLGLKKLVAQAKVSLKPWSQGWGVAMDAVIAAIHHESRLPVIKPVT